MKCPQCHNSYRDLPPHLHNVHGWLQISSSAASGMFGLKKTSGKAPKNKPRPRKMCPFPNCHAVTKNPGEHLRSKKHRNVKPSDYDRILKLFKEHDPTLLEDGKLDGSPAKYAGLKTKETFKKVGKRNPNVDIDEPEPNGMVTDLNDGVVPCQPTNNEIVDSGNSHFLEDVMKKYYDYMTGPNRGRKPSGIDNEVYTIRRILQNIGVDTENDIHKLLIEANIYGYITFCEEKNTKPGSIWKYLASLRDFLKHLTRSDWCSLDSSRAVKMDIIIQEWQKNYKRKDKLYSHKRKADDRKMLINQDQVQAFDKGEEKMKALSLLENFRADPTLAVTRNIFCTVRDYLIVEIQLCNASRSGISVHLLLNEFHGAVEIENIFNIPVWDHKTLETYGPAPIIASKELYNNIMTYIENIRSKVPIGVGKHVFCSWSGKMLQSSDPSKMFRKVWEKSGNLKNKEALPKNLTVNHIRKSVSTAARASGNAFTKEIALAMSHSLKTANTHYDIFEMEQSTIVGARQIQMLLRGEGNSSTISSTNDVQSPSSSTNDVQSPSSSTCDIQTPTTPTFSRKRKAWDVSEVETLKKEIEKGTPLKEIHIKTTSPRQIYDKARRLSLSPVKV